MYVFILFHRFLSKLLVRGNGISCFRKFLTSLIFIPVVPVNVSCTRSEFTILIPQQSLPQLDRERIYLGNPTCVAQLTATSYKILAQFVNCGTASQVTSFVLLPDTQS